MSVRGRLARLERRRPRGRPVERVRIDVGSDDDGEHRGRAAPRAALASPTGVVIDFGEGDGYRRGLAAPRRELDVDREALVREVEAIVAGC